MSGENIKNFKIVPVPKPRMTQRDKWAKRPAVMRYRAFCDECRANNMTIDDRGACIIFTLPMPKTWSAKKSALMDGTPHQQKPDIDNLIKAVFDAVLKEDCHVWQISACKVWGREGSITIAKENV